MHSCITSEPALLVEQLIGCNERLFRVNQCCNTEEEKDTQVGILHTGKRAHWTHSELDQTLPTVAIKNRHTPNAFS